MKNKALTTAENIISALNSGTMLGSVDVHYVAASPVAASATITLTYANIDADDTVTVANVELTAKASGANGTTQFNKQTDATVTAANLAACINANTTLNKIVTASSAAAVVTVTSVVKGVIGNGLALATSDATAFALVAFASGAGGQNGTPVTYS
jgi:phage tail sheath gpL-like